MASTMQANGHVPGSISINNGPPQPLRTPNAKEQRRSTKYKHTFAVHSENRTSCLSHESSPPSFFGFRNLMGLVLIVSNLRLMMENFKKYGILVTLSGAHIRTGDWQWFGILYLLTPCFLFIAYAIEALAAQYAKSKVAERKRSEDKDKEHAQQAVKRHIFSTWRVIAFCHGFNATLMLVISTFVVYYDIINPGKSAVSRLSDAIRSLHGTVASRPTRSLVTCPAREASFNWWMRRPCYPSSLVEFNATHRHMPR